MGSLQRSPDSVAGGKGLQFFPKSRFSKKYLEVGTAQGPTPEEPKMKVQDQE